MMDELRNLRDTARTRDATIGDLTSALREVERDGDVAQRRAHRAKSLLDEALYWPPAGAVHLHV